MKTPAELEKYFSTLGAVFLTPPGVLIERVRRIRALVFDWDGVFNSGVKGDGVSSTFSEADSMGTNLLRYALWRAHGKLPITVIVTGAENPSARKFAFREHFAAVYSNVLDKSEAIAAVREAHGIEGQEIACVFDDVNDLAMAAECGLRCLVRRDASPLVQDFVAERGLCDYITAMRADDNAVREIAELLIGLLGEFDAVADSRMRFDADYASYFSARQAVQTESLTVEKPQSEIVP